MIWYKTNQTDHVLLQARAEFDDRESLGDVRSEMLPGEEYAGLSYEQWRSLPDGAIEVGYGSGSPVSARPIERGDVK